MLLIHGISFHQFSFREYDIFQCLEGNFELHLRVVVLGSDDKGRGGETFHYKENIGAKGEAVAKNKMDPKGKRFVVSCFKLFSIIIH